MLKWAQEERRSEVFGYLIDTTMRFPVLLIVTGVTLSLHASIAEATLSMLMGSMRANQRYGGSSGSGTASGYGGYGSYYSTTKPPTIGSIIGSAIDGLQTLKGMVMSPMMDMAANLMMMASNRATTPVPTYPPAPMTYAPPSSNYPAAPSPAYPTDMYANGYSGYYSSGTSNNYVSGSANTPVSHGYYSNKNDDQQSADASSKENFYGGASSSSSSSSYGKYAKAAIFSPSSSSASASTSASNTVKRSTAGVAYLSDSPSSVFSPTIRYIGTAGPVKRIGNGFLWPKRKQSGLATQDA